MEPLYNAIVKRILTEESKEILEFLKEKAYVYHTPYKRYNKMVKVPRGQVSFTMNENIHYNYGLITGGSLPNEIMCDRLREITQRVNMVMGRNYNTILMFIKIIKTALRLIKITRFVSVPLLRRVPRRVLLRVRRRRNRSEKQRENYS